jgi:hypothetical protein
MLASRLAPLVPALVLAASVPTPSPVAGAAAADSTVVPLEVDAEGRAVVLARLNGRGPYRLAVETGSPDVLVSSSVVSQLSLAAAGVRGADSVFRLDSLQLGDRRISGLRVGRNDAFARLGVDGVLGLEAYAGLLLTIDYTQARLVLSDDTLPAPDGLDVLRAVRVGPFLGIEVDLAGVKETGVVDTQGGVTFQALPAVADRLAFATPLQVVGRAVVGGTEPVEVRAARLAGELRLGRHRFSRPRIAVHALPPDIPARVTIGVEALRHFVVTVDQRTMAIRLTRADTTAIGDA